MRKSAEILKRYLEGYYITLKNAVDENYPPKVIDDLLDRINEVKQMIKV